MFHYICPINIYMNNIYSRVKEAQELPVCLLLPDKIRPMCSMNAPNVVFS